MGRSLFMDDSWLSVKLDDQRKARQQAENDAITDRLRKVEELEKEHAAASEERTRQAEAAMGRATGEGPQSIARSGLSGRPQQSFGNPLLATPADGPDLGTTAPGGSSLSESNGFQRVRQNTVAPGTGMQVFDNARSGQTPGAGVATWRDKSGQDRVMSITPTPKYQQEVGTSPEQMRAGRAGLDQQASAYEQAQLDAQSKQGVELAKSQSKVLEKLYGDLDKYAYMASGFVQNPVTGTVEKITDPDMISFAAARVDAIRSSIDSITSGLGQGQNRGGKQPGGPPAAGGKGSSLDAWIKEAQGGGVAAPGQTPPSQANSGAKESPQEDFLKETGTPPGDIPVNPTGPDSRLEQQKGVFDFLRNPAFQKESNADLNELDAKAKAALSAAYTPAAAAATNAGPALPRTQEWITQKVTATRPGSPQIPMTPSHGGAMIQSHGPAVTPGAPPQSPFSDRQAVAPPARQAPPGYAADETPVDVARRSLAGGPGMPYEPLQTGQRKRIAPWTFDELPAAPGSASAMSPPVEASSPEELSEWVRQRINPGTPSNETRGNSTKGVEQVGELPKTGGQVITKPVEDDGTRIERDKDGKRVVKKPVTAEYDEEAPPEPEAPSAPSAPEPPLRRKRETRMPVSDDPGYRIERDDEGRRTVRRLIDDDRGDTDEIRRPVEDTGTRVEYDNEGRRTVRMPVTKRRQQDDWIWKRINDHRRRSR